MGYDLFSHNITVNYDGVLPEDEWNASIANLDHYRFSTFFWPVLLKLAHDYGWEPMGTDDPCEYSDDPEVMELLRREWDGSYFYNEGQTVTSQDVLNLAAALEKALDDIPDNNDLSAKLSVIDKFLFGEIDKVFMEKFGSKIDPNINLKPFEVDGGGRQYLVDFITFCRKVGFSIS